MRIKEGKFYVHRIDCLGVIYSIVKALQTTNSISFRGLLVHKVNTSPLGNLEKINGEYIFTQKYIIKGCDSLEEARDYINLELL